MGAKFPGKGDHRSAPYQKLFSNPSSVDLTEQLSQCKNASSGMIVIATGAAAALTWKDCAGNSVALTGIDDNVILDLPFAATELTSSTTVDVIVYWHSTPPR